jgi:gas vesicle protein
MNSGKVVLGALAGLAAGAILGILFAPDKGTNTRKKIADKGKGSIDDIKKKYDDVVGSIASKFESAKSEASNYINEGKELAADAKRTVESNVK